MDSAPAGGSVGAHGLAAGVARLAAGPGRNGYGRRAASGPQRRQQPQGGTHRRWRLRARPLLKYLTCCPGHYQDHIKDTLQLHPRRATDLESRRGRRRLARGMHRLRRAVQRWSWRPLWQAGLSAADAACLDKMPCSVHISPCSRAAMAVRRASGRRGSSCSPAAHKTSKLLQSADFFSPRFEAPFVHMIPPSTEPWAPFFLLAGSDSWLHDCCSELAR